MSSCANQSDDRNERLYEYMAPNKHENKTSARLARLGDWLALSHRQFDFTCKPSSHGSSVPEATLPDLRLLAAHILGISKTYLIAHPELELNPNQAAALQFGLARLRSGEALPYILGQWEFYGRMFTLNRHVLIPRPETEMLVEQALEWARHHPLALRFADAGTGSGCIAASLALECPNAQVYASDISVQALQIARTNLARHHLTGRVQLVLCDLLAALAPHSIDILCANLPYIPSARLHDLAVAHHEPLLALDGGEDGLALISPIIRQAAWLLKPGGLALLEIDETHSAAVLALARQSFGSEAWVLNDYQGKPRLLRIEKED